MRDARALIGASAASQLGDWLYNAALLAYVYSATGSAAWVGAATVGRLLPYVLLGPVGGAVADRFPRRTVLLAGDLLRLLAMLGLAASVAADAPVALIITLTAVASAAGTAEKPAAIAMLPRIVGELRLGAANALLHTVQAIGVVAGPALGGLLIAVAPDWVAFLVNAGTFAVSALLVSTITPQSAPAGARSARVGRQVAEGLRAAAASPYALALLGLVAMAELTYGAQTVQLVIYAREDLGLGEGGYGLLLTALGVGAVLSAAVGGRLASGKRVVAAVAGAGALVCATQLAFAATDALAVALLAAVAAGAGLVVCEVVAETVLTGLVPSERLGRVMGIFDAGLVAAMVLGAVLAPPLVEATSLGASFVVLGAGALLATALAAVGLRGLDAVRTARLDALQARLRVLEQMTITDGVSRAVLERLASAVRECSLPAGVDVVVEGAPAHAFYAIAEGRAVVHRGGQRIVGLGPGEGFGERGLLDDAPRNATVTTETDALLLRMDGGALLEALGAAPGFRESLDRSNRHRGDPAGLVDDPLWVPA